MPTMKSSSPAAIGNYDAPHVPQQQATVSAVGGALKRRYAIGAMKTWLDVFDAAIARGDDPFRAIDIADAWKARKDLWALNREDGMARKQMNIRLDELTRTTIKRLAEQHNMSESQVITRAVILLEQELKHTPPPRSQGGREEE